MKKFLAVFLVLCQLIGLGCIGFALGMSSVDPSTSIQKPSDAVTEPPNPELSPEPREQTPHEDLPSEDEIFPKFTKEYWENLSASEIESLCEELALLISYDLALETFVEIKLIYDTTKNWTGLYNNYQKLIKINIFRLNQYKDPQMGIVNILAHEMRHAYQHQRILQGFDTKLEYSLNHYIQPEDDFNAYYNQLCEKDARNYGDYWESLLKLWLAV